MSASPTRPLVIIGPDPRRNPGGISLFSKSFGSSLAPHFPVTFRSWSRPYPGPKRTADAHVPELDLFSPRSWREVAADIRTLSPRAVFLNWVHPVQFAPFRALLKMLQPIPCWIICHNVVPHEPFPGSVRLLRAALSRAGGFIVHGEEPERELLSLFPGRPVKRLFLPPLGTVTPLKEPEEPPTPNGLKLLAFGHVRPYKGLEVLLEAFAVLLNRLPESTLVIAGRPLSGSLLPGASKRFTATLRERARKLGIDGRLTFRFEYLSEPDLRAQFAAADSAVFPFLAKTPSASLITALAHGLPVVVSDVPGLREFVLSGRNGMLAEPGNSEDLADALEALHAVLPARAAVRQTVSELNWDTYGKRLLEAVF